MNLTDATSLISSGVPPEARTWADIGAGTGMFTRALGEVLNKICPPIPAPADNQLKPISSTANAYKETANARIYAVDKSPHALWDLPVPDGVEVFVVEGDFNKTLDLPMLDGIVMANALHYAKDPVFTLNNILQHLNPQGTFILVEYETEIPHTPWVPYPVSFRKFESLCRETGMRPPDLLGKVPSHYGYTFMYAAVTRHTDRQANS
jgi:SAM-dependent methyltransferase